MAITHSGNIDIQVVLGAVPVQAAGFGTILHLAPDQPGMAANEVLTLNSSDDLEAAFTAGTIDAEARDAGRAAFGQTPSPSSLKIGNVDVLGGDGYDDALIAIRVTDDAFYGITMESRVSADILLVAAAMAALPKFLMFQSAEADILTAGFPAALAAISTQENVAGVYHDDATEFADVAALARWTTFDPDNTSAPSSGPLGVIASYTTALTSTQSTNACDNNINTIAPFGPEPTYFDPGVTLEGRQMYEVLTKHWYAARLEEALIRLRLNLDAAGAKLALDASGQYAIRGVLEGIYEAGVAAGHFLPGQHIVEFPDPISQADLDAGCLRASVYITLAVSARVFKINTIITRSAVVA